MLLYEYIYHRLYVWSLRVWGSSDAPQYNACLGLSLLSVMNLFSALIALGVEPPTPARVFAVGAFALSLTAHYLYFVRSGRFLALGAAQDTEPPLSSRAGSAIVFGYIVGSLGLFFALLAARQSNAAG